MKRGPFLALLSAALFGASPALVKFSIGELSPFMTAGLLYLGSGVGLQLMIFLQRKSSVAEFRMLNRLQRLKLLGAILSGGVLAPLLLCYGIRYATATEVSLLLNLETVATTVLAYFLFHEHVGTRVWLGKVLLLAGAALLILHPGDVTLLTRPGLLIVLACLFWGLDNNLTRDLEELSPSVLASIKGLSAGSFNLLLALVMGLTEKPAGSGLFSGLESLTALHTLGTIGAIAVIGAFSYGVSLILFVLALREIGSSRTTTYFSAGPFFGMLFSIVLLKETPGAAEWGASMLMLAGLWALYGENHEHAHTHEAISHSHPHVHDDHHQHTHDGMNWSGNPQEPHEHPHTHEPVTHTHHHLPDIHHRHSH